MRRLPSDGVLRVFLIKKREEKKNKKSVRSAKEEKSDVSGCSRGRRASRFFRFSSSAKTRLERPFDAPRWRSPNPSRAFFPRSDPSSVSSMAHRAGLAQQKEHKEPATRSFPGSLEKWAAVAFPSSRGARRRAGTFSSSFQFLFVALPAPRSTLSGASLPLLLRFIEASQSEAAQREQKRAHNAMQNPFQSPSLAVNSPCKPRRLEPLSASSTISSSAGCPTCPRPCCRGAAPAPARQTWRARRPAGPSSRRWHPCP